MRRSHSEHCTHSTLIVHLLPSKEKSCRLDSRNLGYNNKPHIRPAQSRRLFKGTVGCTFSPLNEAPTLPLRYILETDAAGCDVQLSSVLCVFLFLTLRTKDPIWKIQAKKKQKQIWKSAAIWLVVAVSRHQLVYVLLSLCYNHVSWR